MIVWLRFRFHDHAPLPTRRNSMLGPEEEARESAAEVPWQTVALVLWANACGCAP